MAIINLNEFQSKQLDKILEAFGNSEYLDLEQIINIEPNETKANGLVNILRDRGFVTRMADTEEKLLPMMLYKDSSAVIFLDNGGFTAEYTLKKHREQSNKLDNIHIHSTGDGNLINTGSQNTIHAVFNNTKNNIKQLEDELKKYHVPETDIHEIMEIVATEVPPNDRIMGYKALNWIKEMLGKSLDGTWEIGIATAGGILTEILKIFTGGKFLLVCIN